MSQMENNWKKGDIAICVRVDRLSGQTLSSLLPPLRLNSEYIVQGIKICECGAVALDVGLGGNNGTECSVCKAISSPNSGIRWVSSKRFVKKRTKQEVNSELNEAVKEENFELASELQKELEKF